MPSIIDSFIITLGLDAAPYEKGSRQAISAFKKTRDEALKNTKQINESTKKLAESFNLVKNGAIAFFATLLGARGIKDFIENVAAANAQLARLSANLSESPQMLTAWGAAVERIGGKSEDAVSSITSLSRAFFDLKNNGKALPDSIYRVFAAAKMTVNPGGGVDQFLNDMAKALQSLSKHDRTAAYFFGKDAGLSDSMINLMIEHGSATAKYVESLKQLGNTDVGYKQAQELQEAFVKMEQLVSKIGQEIGNWITPGLIKFFNDIDVVLQRLVDHNNFENEPGRKLLATPGGGAELLKPAAPYTGSGKVVNEQGQLVPDSGGITVDPDVPAEGSATQSLGGADLGSLTGSAVIAAWAKGGTTVDGKPVSRGNPMPVMAIGTGTSNGGFFSKIGDAIDGLFGNSSGSSSTAASGPSGSASALPDDSSGSVTASGPFKSSSDVKDYIRQAAIARGVNPDYALRVVNGEGGFSPNKSAAGDENSSFGPFQLHYGGISRRFPHSGLGDAFTKATGLSAKSGATIKQQIDFALNEIVRGGWGPWAGSSSHSMIRGRMGIAPGAHTIPISSGAQLSSVSASHPVTTSSSSNEMHIGKIDVNAPNATDADGIASGISGALARYGFAATANSGQM